jgi:hypothetical protein
MHSFSEYLLFTIVSRIQMLDDDGIRLVKMVDERIRSGYF